MLEIQKIRDNKQAVLDGLKKRGIDATADIATLLNKDDERKALQISSDSILAEMNKLAKDIGMFFKGGSVDDANKLKALVAVKKEEQNALKEKHAAVVEAIQELLYQIPNVPNIAVPHGKLETDNEIVFEYDVNHTLPEKAVPHWDICKQYNLVDFELGTKIAGAGFPVYRGKGAKLQRALIQFFLDCADEAGYEEVIPPHVVNEASGYGTGQLPDKEGQMYHVGIDDLYLIPTAEVPITNIFRDEIVDGKELPIKLTGYTPCFRREAGSYGKDVRGLNRLHQFDKVEIVRIEKPENSYQALDEMVEYVKGILEKLQLKYRILRLCGGDLGFTSCITYDFEVYSAAQERWLEVSSVSNFETFQANRLKLRYKDGKNKGLAHTLNGSALALPRMVAAILENYQTENGIQIPEVLIPYTKFNTIN